jgi:uncharacterized lipoprotein YddW (UPF0748 family)
MLVIMIGCRRIPARDQRVAFDQRTLVQQADRTVEGRAIWVTRWDYKTADDVRRIIDNCAAAHFNMILFQVRGNGTAFYKSSYEPWAWELTSSSPLTTGRDPGFDPLDLAIKRAHKQGVELHAYMNVLPAWRSQSYPPREADQLWTRHPEWFMVDRQGNRQVPWDPAAGNREIFYAFLSPGIPEAREYTASVFREVAQRYDLDGIHLDYIRYPHEVGDYSYDPVSLQRFKTETGKTPDDDPDLWTLWRGQQVSAAAARIYEDCKAAAPHLIVSASVMFDPVAARDKAMQRSLEWMEAGKIDAVFPMIYKKDNAIVAASITDYRLKSNGRLVFAGLMVLKDPILLIDQIEVARTAGAQGISLFSYEALFPKHEPNALARVLAEGPFRQKARVPLPPAAQAPRVELTSQGLDEPVR